MYVTVCITVDKARWGCNEKKNSTVLNYKFKHLRGQKRNYPNLNISITDVKYVLM